MKKNQRIIDSLFAKDSDVQSSQLLLEGKAIKGAEAKVLFDNCEAKIVRYKKGAVIPLHHHSEETLKFLLRGRIETKDGEQLISGIGDYRCGGHEYGPWRVIDEAFILVLQKPGTKSIAGKKKK